MNPRNAGLRWLYFAGVTLAVLCTAFAAYSFLYFDARYDYYVQRDFRALDEIASQLDARFRHLKHVFDFWPRTEAGVEYHERLIRRSSPYRDLKVEPWTPTKRAEVANPPGGGSAKPAVGATPAPEIDPKPGQPPLFRVAANGGSTKLKFRYDPGKNPIQATISLKHLIEVDRIRENFDQFLIARGNGQVIYELSDAGLHFSKLGALLAESEAEPAAAVATDDPVGVLRQALHAANLDPEGVDPSARSSLLKTRAGDRDVLVFMQPYRPVFGSLAPEEENESWYMAGIVAAGGFNAKVRSVPLSVMAAVLLALTLGVLAWPYLKVILVSPSEKLNSGDAHFLLGALVLGVGLISLIAMNVVTYVGLRGHFDAVAAGIADRMRTHLKAELAQSERELADVEQELCEGKPRQAMIRDGVPQVPPADIIAWGDEYPSYELAFLLDSEAWQVGPQRTYREVGLEPIHVPERQYFTRAHLGPLPFRSSTADSDTGVGGFFAERVETYDHGWKLTILSKPTEKHESRFATPPSAAGRPECGAATVVAMGKHLKTLWSPVLPPGFGFAVIQDDTSRVLFHSEDQARSLIEKLFVEADGNPELEAAVRMRRSTRLTGSYRGVRHRFHTSPIDGTPWSLIVFYEGPMLHALNFEIVLTVGFYLLVYTGILGAGIIVATLAAGKTRWSWIWPDSRLSQRYKAAVLFLLLLAAYNGALVWVVDGVWLALVLLSLPLISLAALYFGFRPAQGSDADRVALPALVLGIASSLLALGGASRLGAAPLLLGGLTVLAGVRLVRTARGEPRAIEESGKRAYVGVGVATLVIIGALPAIGLFKDAYQCHSEKLIRYGQLEVARSLNARANDIHADAVRLNPSRFSRLSTKTPVGLGSADLCRGYYVAPGIYDAIDAKPATGSRAGDCVRPDAGAECCGRRAPSAIPADEESATASARLDAQILAAMGKRLTGWMALNFPIYSAESAEIRNVLYDEADDDKVRWQTPEEIAACGTGGSIALCYDGGGDRVYRLASQPLAFPWPTPGPAWVFLAFGAAALVICVWYAVATLAKRILGIDLVEFAPMWVEPTEAAGWLAHSRIIVRPDPKYVDELCRKLKHEIGEDKVEVIRLPLTKAIAKRGADALAGNPAAPDLCIITGFESRIIDDELRLGLLDALERRVLHARKPVLIFSEISPLYRWSKPSAYPDSAETDPNADEQLRWARLLGAFRKERFPAPKPNVGMGAPRRLSFELERECGWAWQLKEIGEIVGNSSAYLTNALTERQLVEQVGDLAAPFYREIWTLCTCNERLVLVSLASDYLVNPQNVDIVERLIRRGLIRRDPAFHLVSESFAAFVRNAESPERLAAWERGATASTWQLIRVPLGVVLVMVALFGAYAGQQAVDATIGVVPALLAIAPLAWRALSWFRGPAGAAAPTS